MDWKGCASNYLHLFQGTIPASAWLISEQVLSSHPDYKAGVPTTSSHPDYKAGVPTTTPLHSFFFILDIWELAPLYSYSWWVELYTHCNIFSQVLIITIFQSCTCDITMLLLQNLESLIHIHNRACHELLTIVTEETLNKCTIGAPEFVKYVPPVNIAECSSTKLYEVMPPYFGSPEYKNSLFEVWLI